MNYKESKKKASKKASRDAEVEVGVNAANCVYYEWLKRTSDMKADWTQAMSVMTVAVVKAISQLARQEKVPVSMMLFCFTNAINQSSKMVDDEVGV